jgi:pantothenate kinase
MAERLTEYGRLLDTVTARVRVADGPLLIGIAGPPATGKSTLAERLVADLESAGFAARYCPMDGFHLTNAQLDAAGLRAAKGRIDTFDAVGFAVAVARLKTGETFWWPRYSRHSHDPVPEGTQINGSEAAFVIEGNYLFTDRTPWRGACRNWDLRVFVDTPDETLRSRLIDRHKRSGRSKRDARDKIETTDMPNAEAIRDGRCPEDILFCKTAGARDV